MRIRDLIDLVDTLLLDMEPITDEWARFEAHKASRLRKQGLTQAALRGEDTRWKTRVVRSYELQLEAVLRDDTIREWFRNRRGQAEIEPLYEDMYRRFVWTIAWFGGRDEPFPEDMEW